MVTKSAEDLIRLTRLVRLCFQRLKTLGDELHADLRLNSSLRAILEAASEEGNRTVPQIAAAKSVSRQHIQKHVDMLIASKHIELRPNPSHKRSPFVVLTKRGATAFAEMKRREGRIVSELLAQTDIAQLPRTVAQLQDFTEALKAHISGDKENDDD
jgi:DNA-binding MarR family transcriptional regulator